MKKICFYYRFSNVLCRTYCQEKTSRCKIVFVGPCVAKRKEAQRDEAVDFVMTFEEISSIFDAMEVNLEIVQPYAMEFSSVREAHGFAQAGGVMGAVKAFLKMEADKINAVQVSDLNKKNIAALRAYAKNGGKLRDNLSK